MKVVVKLLILSILIGVLIIFPFGCSSNLDTDEAYALIKNGIENSMASPFYYYKETLLKDGQARTTRVNLLGDIDGDYQPITDTNGIIQNYKLNIIHLQGEKIVSNLYCGKPIATSEEWLIINNNGKKTSQKMRLAQYLVSEEFKPYSLEEALLIISDLTPEDIVITSATKQGKVALVKFTVTNSYLASYQQKNGKASIFDGIKYAEVEIAYDRISAITTYSDTYDERSKLKVEVEPYRLHITYYGPDFTVSYPDM
ncbi:MAG: hypothetical protein WC292_05685 [Clostridia bacterium]